MGISLSKLTKEELIKYKVEIQKLIQKSGVLSYPESKNEFQVLEVIQVFIQV